MFTVIFRVKVMRSPPKISEKDEGQVLSVSIKLWREFTSCLVAMETRLIYLYLDAINMFQLAIAEKRSFINLQAAGQGVGSKQLLCSPFADKFSHSP
ncbi:hypothetical protein NC652_019934 [Populus alba x Populus x berolinensis]|nr:hypothetical protein NC652_019934 [Populus alba x Populus x berolinensis]